MLWRISLALALILAAHLGPTLRAGAEPAYAPEKRVALVIGNGAYANAPRLANPVTDARAVADSLRQLGVSVTEGYDLSSDAMRALLIEFSNSLAGAKGAILYYAGHGVAAGGENYLLPVDIKVKSLADLDLNAVALSVILRQMKRDERVNIVILDACRDNPFAASLDSGSRSLVSPHGLDAVNGELARGALVAFATDPGAVAFDGPPGQHSPFTAALLNHLSDTDTPVEVMMHRVRDEVWKATGEKQLPWVNTSIIGDFEFNPLEPAPAAAATPEVREKAVDPEESVFWQSAEKGGTADDYLAYLKRYPNGAFAALAANRLNELNAKRNAPVPSAPTPSASAASLATPEPSLTRAPAIAPAVAEPTTRSTAAAPVRPRPVSEAKPARRVVSKATPERAARRNKAGKPSPANTVSASEPHDDRCAPGFHVVLGLLTSNSNVYSCKPN
jgi:uncharacterized caspase-like protein